MKARETDKGKITALYERLSRDDDLTRQQQHNQPKEVA